MIHRSRVGLKRESHQMETGYKVAWNVGKGIVGGRECLDDDGRRDVSRGVVNRLSDLSTQMKTID